MKVVLRNKAIWKVKMLIIGRCTITQWCNLRSTIPRDVVLVWPPILTKHESSNICNLTSRVISESIVVSRMFSSSHEEVASA